MRYFLVIFVAELLVLSTMILFGIGQGLSDSPGLAFVSNKEGVSLTWVSGSEQVRDDTSHPPCKPTDSIFVCTDSYTSYALFSDVFTGKPRRIVSIEYSENTDNTYLSEHDVYDVATNYATADERQHTLNALAAYHKQQ